jgi:ribosome-associated protein
MADEAAARPAEETLKRGIPEREHPRAVHGPLELEAIRDQARWAAGVAADLKGEDIRILDMHSLVSYTDFLVVCTGRSTRQTRRIAEEVGLRLKRDHDLRPGHMEGEQSGEWILLDYLDFVVHVFTPEARDFYRLDVLWKDAPAESVE